MPNFSLNQQAKNDDRKRAEGDGWRFQRHRAFATRHLFVLLIKFLDKK